VVKEFRATSILLKAVGWSPALSLPLLASLVAMGFEELPSTGWEIGLVALLLAPPVVVVLHLHATKTLSIEDKRRWRSRLFSAQGFGEVFRYLLTDDGARRAATSTEEMQA
jgi:hypothetical protein